MLKVLQGYDVQKLFERTHKEKYHLKLIDTDYWFTTNKMLNNDCLRFKSVMESGTMKIGDTDIYTAAYYTAKQQLDNLMATLTKMTAEFNDKVILRKWYQFEVDDEDRCDND